MTGLLTLSDWLLDTVIALFAIACPAYYTYKALKNKTAAPRLIWLRYWVVYSVFHMATLVTDVLLAWLPFYSTVKVLFSLWLVSSKASGAQLVYAYGLEPLLRTNEKEIDRQIKRLQKQATDLFWTLFSRFGAHSTLLMVTFVRQYMTAVAFGGGPSMAVDGLDAIVGSEEEEMEESDPPSVTRPGNKRGKVATNGLASQSRPSPATQLNDEFLQEVGHDTSQVQAQPSSSSVANGREPDEAGQPALGTCFGHSGSGLQVVSNSSQLNHVNVQERDHKPTFVFYSSGDEEDDRPPPSPNQLNRIDGSKKKRIVRRGPSTRRSART